MSFPLDEPSHSHTRQCVDGRCVPREAEHRTSGGRDGYHSNLAQVSSAVLKSNRFNVDAPHRHRRNGNRIPDGSVGGRESRSRGHGNDRRWQDTPHSLAICRGSVSLSLFLFHHGPFAGLLTSRPAFPFRRKTTRPRGVSFALQNRIWRHGYDLPP